MINHKEQISKPHFLFSAENPKFPEHNKLGLTHEQALQHLKDKGYNAHTVSGHYGSPERSIVVYDVKPHHINPLHQFASKLGQDSSIHSTGKEHEMRFHHGEDAGKKITGSGTEWHAEKPKDFFTTLPSGEHFTHNFGKSEGEPQNIKLLHFSSHPNLTHVDPKFKGTGVDYRTKGRETWHPHSFYYRHGSEPESVVTSQSPHEYHAEINTKEHPIYDIGKDPHNIVRTSVEENQGAKNMEDVHERLKNAGYHGFYNTAHPTLSNVVAMYHPLPVTKIKKSLYKAENPEAYKKLAEKGLMIGYPVRIQGKEDRPDIGIPYHSTLKFFNPNKDSPEQIHHIANKLPLTPPDPKQTHIEPGKFKDRFGNDVYVLKLHGPHADQMKEHHKEFSHMGYPANFEFHPHVSVDKDTWDKISSSGAKTAYDAGIEFGHAQIRQGHNVTHDYSPKIKKSEEFIKDSVFHDFELKKKYSKTMYLDGEFLINFIKDNPELIELAEASFQKRLDKHFLQDKDLYKIASEKGIREAYRHGRK